MLLNGKEYRVRKNLWDFLTIARTKYSEPKRAFWMDALCIDQHSILERSHQVAQMGSIYSKARDVVAWLGSTPFDLCLLKINIEREGQTNEGRGSDIQPGMEGVGAESRIWRERLD
jgi:hypothetical protein